MKIFCQLLQKHSMKIRFLLQRAQSLTAREETADGDNQEYKEAARQSWWPWQTVGCSTRWIKLAGVLCRSWKRGGFGKGPGADGEIPLRSELCMVTQADVECRDEPLTLVMSSSGCREFAVGEMGRNRRGQEQRSRGRAKLGGEGSAAHGEASI